MSAQHDYALLSRPPRLYSRREVLIRPYPVPARPGVYAWYFREVPPSVRISPSKPPSNGKSPSRQSLARRVRYHFAGNAEGSTLRLTLGCLLGDQLGIRLTRVGSGGRGAEVICVDGEIPLTLGKQKLSGAARRPPLPRTNASRFSLPRIRRMLRALKLPRFVEWCWTWVITILS
jgi:hypothetical protein